ncbi:DNA-processing protein DprA [Pedobacter psychroterrae]|uniref:DNA-protecting protein DprA n=1 Tax=Pedobacter psychroterrae TaxID=2530453 RepID=A0A4R0NIF2_9SPHI|nr:DNA-processing protein DprA [Pedobacter psychroterrae]TCD00412.1 DNA-protecting protein DprA [Pedobacter psychroterrae]
MSLIHNIALTFIPEVGHVTAKNLLGHFGSSEAIFKAKKNELVAVPGIGPQTARHILDNNALQDAEKQLKFIEHHAVQALFYTDEAYPHRLRNCFDAPVLLYYRGNADLNHSRIISIVGTRKATEYGRQLCKQLCETLAAYDVLIVSGLAYGIDIAAHKESVYQNIPTVGILAHGLDRIYPPIHHPVAQKMLLNGGLLTEFPLNTTPEKENFPKRNRIIAGLSDATIVVEATAKGGALITADIANSYNRDVYAFPGRVNDVSSQGCNFLIKTNRAGLIGNANDLLYYLGWDDKKKVQQEQLQMPMGLSAEEQKIVEILQGAPARVDELAIRSEIPQSQLAMHLLNLEMQGILVSLPGKVYQLN